jgi:DNA-binding YbaB/EbfC family protein
MRNAGNMMGMMKKAQKMQSDMKIMQEELKGMTFDGEAGGGLVKAQISGDGKAKSLSVDDSLVVPADKEDMEDLIIVAFNNARESMEEYTETQTKSIMGDLQLPPGFNL